MLWVIASVIVVDVPRYRVRPLAAELLLLLLRHDRPVTVADDALALHFVALGLPFYTGDIIIAIGGVLRTARISHLYSLLEEELLLVIIVIVIEKELIAAVGVGRAGGRRKVLLLMKEEKISLGTYIIIVEQEQLLVLFVQRGLKAVVAFAQIFLLFLLSRLFGELRDCGPQDIEHFAREVDVEVHLLWVQVQNEFAFWL